jgi:hypothetical protein
MISLLKIISVIIFNMPILIATFAGNIARNWHNKNYLLHHTSQPNNLATVAKKFFNSRSRGNCQRSCNVVGTALPRKGETDS